MRHSIRTAVTVINFIVLFAACNAFTPLEFIQHLQQQQQRPQNQDVQQPMIIQTPQNVQIPQNGQAQQNNQQPEQSPAPQPELPREIFKPFSGEKPSMLKGCFTLAENQSNNKIPQIRVYFEGKETISDEDGFFSIPLDEDHLEKYKLVIAKTFQQDFDQHNTIKDLRLIADKHYKCYSFKKRGPFGGMWVQREKDLTKKKFIIPNNAIIILLDPKYVDHLEAWSVNLASNFVKLPKIVLKNEVHHKTSDRAAAKSLLTSLDAAVFHEEVREVVKHPTEKITISLVQ